jgi:hypothetical protein
LLEVHHLTKQHPELVGSGKIPFVGNSQYVAGREREREREREWGEGGRSVTTV